MIPFIWNSKTTTKIQPNLQRQRVDQLEPEAKVEELATKKNQVIWKDG